MGHVWLGFDEDALKRLLVQAGFEGIRIASLPTDADAKGPALFVAGARKKLNAEFSEAVSMKFSAEVRSLKLSAESRKLEAESNAKEQR